MISVVVESKVQLRARIRAGRASAVRRTPSPHSAHHLLRVARAAGLIESSRGPGGARLATIAAYIAAPGEPDVGAIRLALRERGGTVLLPIPRPGRTLDWAEDDGNYRPYERLPIEVPCGPVVGTGALGLLDRGVGVVLVPALAVDSAGARLGQGGGFYDHLITELNEHSGGAVRVVAVVHDDEVLPARTIPREAHDQLVQGALTPSRWWDFSH